MTIADRIQQFAARGAEFHIHGHVAVGVGGAAQARVEGADHGFHAVQHAFVEAAAMHEMARHLQHAAFMAALLWPWR